MNENSDKTIKGKLLDIYKLITFMLIVLIVICSYYFSYIKLFSPVLILLVIYITRIIKISNNCDESKSLPYINLLYRCLVLLSIYLYSEYTVKCIPILNLIFNNIFDFPITGKILKCFFSYILLEFGDNILNNIDNTQTKNFLDDICIISLQKNNNFYYLILILSLILINTYVDSVRDYF